MTKKKKKKICDVCDEVIEQEATLRVEELLERMRENLERGRA